MQHLLRIFLHLRLRPALHQIGGHIVTLTVKSGQVLRFELLKFLIIKRLHQIHDIIRHSDGCIHRNIVKINIHIPDNIIIRSLGILGITGSPATHLGTFSVECTIGIIIIKPEWYIITVDTIQSHLRQKICRCKNTFFKFITDQLFAAFLTHTERYQHMRCIASGYLIVYDHIVVAVGALSCGGTRCHWYFTTTVWTYLIHLFQGFPFGCRQLSFRLICSCCLGRFRRNTVFVTARLDHAILAFFTVLALTERTEHFLSLRAVDHITATVFTLKDHLTPRLLPFTTFFLMELPISYHTF